MKQANKSNINTTCSHLYAESQITELLEVEHKMVITNAVE